MQTNTALLSAGGGGAQTLLAQSDLTYLGTQAIAETYNGKSTLDGQCLGYRYVGGQLRFFITVFGPSYWQQVIELNSQGFSTTSPPTATLSRDWGDIYDGKMLTDNPDNAVIANGLFWDSVDSRLYWSYGNNYNGSDSDYCLGYSTLNDSNGQSTGFGPWSVGNGITWKACQGCVTPVPASFRSTYNLGNKRLAMGAGGAFSLVTGGATSMGPAMAAFDPSALPAEGGTISPTVLCYYPYSATPKYGPPDRCHRNTNYTDGMVDNWDPSGGIGYWQWVDEFRQGGTWIESASRKGILFGATIGQGDVFYDTSDRFSEDGNHMMMVYDPAHFGSVATGATASYNIQPTNKWDNALSAEFGYPFNGFGNQAVDGRQGYEDQLNAVVYDTTANRVYVRVKYHGIMAFQLPS